MMEIRCKEVEKIISNLTAPPEKYEIEIPTGIKLEREKNISNKKKFKIIILFAILFVFSFCFILKFFPQIVKPKIHLLSLEKVYIDPHYSTRLNNSKVKLKGIMISPFSKPVIGGWVEENGFTIPIENLSHSYQAGDTLEVTGIFYSKVPSILATEDVYLNHTGLESIKYQIKNVNEIQRKIEIGKVIKILNLNFKNKTISELHNFFELTFDDIKGYCYDECEKIEIDKNYTILATLLNHHFFRILWVEEVK